MNGIVATDLSNYNEIVLFIDSNNRLLYIFQALIKQNISAECLTEFRPFSMEEVHIKVNQLPGCNIVD